ncbi:ribonuclease H-like YkuK family protein [Paraflavitalea sp. CAU 1676]|uniref:ribonuclease H-like YkuK family protein n=1 Tax=Paraflavitalea sp. CAU 1676 TaxID=3032598 RepID=UPI0023DA948B|nr:ribonuclease H-like YkuK family protein [Paraflavitalea sp. CAU 1676]MDF2190659.1 ribonuclease H-like YkuK family protein [Paraflavitalea sp. CAU 1676]
MEQQWQRLDGSAIRRPIEDEIRSVLAREKANGHDLKVCIGTDSQVRAGNTAFATVIVFLRKGKGGFMYVLSDNSRQRMSLKERMLTEVGKSIEVAYGLCGLFTTYDVDMEVHADINTNPQFQSNHALKDAMGYIMGMGFAFKAKPYAFASSCCADKAI